MNYRLIKDWTGTSNTGDSKHTFRKNDLVDGTPSQLNGGILNVITSLATYNIPLSNVVAVADVSDVAKLPAAQQEELKKKWKLSNSTKSFGEWFQAYQGTEEGGKQIEALRGMFSMWLDKKLNIQPLDENIDNGGLKPQKILGMPPILFAFVTIGFIGGLITLFVVINKTPVKTA